MYYKRNNAWGIRAQDGPQVFQILLKGHSKDEGCRFADKCLAMLHRGVSVPDVAAFIAQKKAACKAGKAQSAQKPPPEDTEPEVTADAQEEGEEEEDAEADAKEDEDDDEEHWDAVDLN